jgi:hypothetical protein
LNSGNTIDRSVDRLDGESNRLHRKCGDDQEDENSPAGAETSVRPDENRASVQA